VDRTFRGPTCSGMPTTLPVGGSILDGETTRWRLHPARMRRSAFQTGQHEHRVTGKFPNGVKNSPSLRVLVVDDEALIRWSVAETLAESGHSVCEAGDGTTAMRFLTGTEKLFDVVLLDYRLPDSNDLNLLAAIRRVAPDTAVIMMTAYGTPEVTSGALKLGAYRVVPKPFEIHDMARLVVQAHESSHPVK
jgi:CheY-like chemotaxis protein